MKRLCLAGGVAHNCTLNGKLLYSGLFEDIFVQPAAHDAGCALGAALMVSNEAGQPAPRERLQAVYWGPDVGGDDSIEQELKGWAGHLEIERTADVAARAAEWIADGAVIGWVQGRSEFGPRALGNRSTLRTRDPRQTRTGSMRWSRSARVIDRLHHRSWRRMRARLELPDGRAEYPFMNFVVRVRESKRSCWARSRISMVRPGCKRFPERAMPPIGNSSMRSRAGQAYRFAKYVIQQQCRTDRRFRCRCDYGVFVDRAGWPCGRVIPRQEAGNNARELDRTRCITATPCISLPGSRSCGPRTPGDSLRDPHGSLQP